MADQKHGVRWDPKADRRAVDANELPLAVVTAYLAAMEDVKSKSATKRMLKPAMREDYTKRFLSAIKRPANLWPVLRLLYPSVFNLSSSAAPCLNQTAGRTILVSLPARGRPQDTQPSVCETDNVPQRSL
jgi:hypothetical protein